MVWGLNPLLKGKPLLNHQNHQSRPPNKGKPTPPKRCLQQNTYPHGPISAHVCDTRVVGLPVPSITLALERDSLGVTAEQISLPRGFVHIWTARRACLWKCLGVSQFLIPSQDPLSSSHKRRQGTNSNNKTTPLCFCLLNTRRIARIDPQAEKTQPKALKCNPPKRHDSRSAFAPKIGSKNSQVVRRTEDLRFSGPELTCKDWLSQNALVKRRAQNLGT